MLPYMGDFNKSNHKLFLAFLKLTNIYLHTYYLENNSKIVLMILIIILLIFIIAINFGKRIYKIIHNLPCINNNKLNVQHSHLKK